MRSAAVAVRVTGYPWPQGAILRGYISTIVMFALSARRELMAPGSWAHETLLATRPRAQEWAPRVQNGLFYLLVAVHTLEVLFVAVPRLRKHGVPVLSATWCKWVFAWFVGGMYAMQHFDAVVAAGAAKKQ